MRCTSWIWQCCNRSCRPRFELATLDNPSQRIRQAGQVRLDAAAARELGQLAIAPAGPQCRLQLTLRHDDDRQQTFELDPCRDAG